MGEQQKTLRIGADTFLRAVHDYVVAHPEIVPDLNEAARQGLLARLRRDQDRACDMEVVALLALSRLPTGRLRAQDRALLRDRLRPWKGQTAMVWDHDLERLGCQLEEEA